MRRGVALITALLTATLGGAYATTAVADTLHAAPFSKRATLPCASDTPCTIGFALTQAVAGDDVALAAGHYYTVPALLHIPFTSLPDVKPGVVVHGDPSGPRPVLHGRKQAIAPLVNILAGGVVRDVNVEATIDPGVGIAYGVLIGPGALLERAIVRTTTVAGTTMAACAMIGGTVRDSVCAAGGPGQGDGLNGTSGNPTLYTVRNVTAVSTAATGFGIRVGASIQTSSMVASNVIARGASGDVAAGAGLAAGHATLVLDHSNWATQVTTGAGTPQIVTVGGNQTGPTAASPLFVDGPGGDYRQAAGSPTIDAGNTDPANGPLALGGQARTLGTATDIGAFEFDPAPAPTTPTPTPADAVATAPGPISSGVVATGDTRAPVISGLSIGRSWRLGTRLVAGSAKHPPIGTTIRLTLSEPSRVTLTFSRPAAGRRVAGTCRRATPATRAKPHCTIPNVRGRLVVQGRAGLNTVRFLGRISRTTRLGAGSHLLTATAVDTAGNRSIPRTARFTILK